MIKSLRRLLKDEEGAALAEYIILVTGIVVGTFAAIGIWGTAIQGFFTNLATTLGLPAA